MTNPGNQGWRSGAAPKGDRKKKRDWRSDTASAGSRVRWGRILKFGAGFGLIAGVVVAIILLLLMADETNVTVVALGPQEYAGLDIPLVELTAAGLVKDWQGKTDVQIYSEAKAEGTFTVPPLTESRAIVYVRALAISTPDGVLLCDTAVTPAMVEARDAGSGTLLKDLAKQLFAQNKPKLVLLDLSPVREQWRLGSFAVDFMGELREIQDRAISSKTIFFSACDVGEKSWRSRSFGGQSVFRYFVQRGLRRDATDSDYVRVSDLIRYVSKETTDWAFQRRETSPGQHPQCVPSLEDLGDELDFTLANVAVNDPLPVPAAPDSREDRDKLRNAWEKYSDLDEAVHRRLPVTWRAHTSKLLTQQQRVALGLKAAISGSSDDEAALAKNQFRIALRGESKEDDSSSESWFGQAVLPRIDHDPRPDPPTKLALAETVLQHNFLWLNRKREQAKQRPLSDEQINAALELQTMAENAHARSAVILPFVKAELDQADMRRRRALDLLFTGAAEGLVSAGGEPFDGVAAMETAQKANVRAGDAIREMRLSHNALLDALAHLPHLARFAAATIPGSAKELLLKTQAEKSCRALFEHPALPRSTADVNNDLEAIEVAMADEPTGSEIAVLFAATRELAVRFARFDGKKAIEESKLQPTPDPQDSAQETQVQRINELGAVVAKRLSRLRERLNGEAKVLGQQKEQSNAEDLASIVRYMQLPFVEAGVRERLFDRRIEFESASAQTPDGSSGTKSGEIWLRRGQWQAFWALQVRSLAPGDGALRAWRKLDSSGDAKLVYAQLADIGQFLRANPIRQPTESTEISLPTVSVAERGKNLRRVDYLSRLESEPDSSRSTLMVPVWQRVQPFFVSEFALHYAKRFEQDFLRDAGSDSGEDWFRSAIDYARALAESNNGRSLQEYSELMTGDAGSPLALKAHAPVQFKRRDTNRQLALQLDNAGLPEELPGIAAAWASRGEASVQPELNGVPVLVDGKSNAVLNLLKPSNAGAGCQQGGLTVDLFFRGHLSFRTFEVDPCTDPDSTVVLHPRPATGAVQVGGRKERSVIFVLDWSLSMLEGETPNTRYEQAVAALGTALSDMRDDDNVGFIIFGHRAKLARDRETILANTDALGKYPGTKKRFASLEEDPQVLVPVGRKTAAVPKIREWLGDLAKDDTLKPFGNTPLYAAIDLARSKLPEGGAIVVVSDGDPDDDPPVGLEASLAGKNIVTTAIQFKFSGDLAPFVRTIPADQGNLGKKIRKAIPPREFTLRNERTSANVPQRSPLGTRIENVAAGTYELGFGLDNTSSGDDEGFGSRIPGLRIRGGELHDYTLQQGEFLRLSPPRVLGQVDATAGKAPDPTLLGHTRFDIKDAGNPGPAGVPYATATIDVALNHLKKNLPIAWPAEIEFEMRPEGQGPSSELDVRFLAGKSVPTYRLQTKKWPAGRGRVWVQAWWKMQRTTAETRVTWKALSERVVELPAVGGLPAVQVTARSSEDPAKGTKGIILNIEAVQPPADGTDSIAGVRVTPGFSSGRGFEPVRVRTEVRRWSDSAAAEFFFEVDPNTADLEFGITSRKALRNGAVTLTEPVLRSPGNAQSSSAAPPK